MSDGLFNKQTRIGLALLAEEVGEQPLGARWRVEWGWRVAEDPWLTVELVLGGTPGRRWAIWTRTGDVYLWPRTPDEEPEPVSDDPVLTVSS